MAAKEQAAKICHEERRRAWSRNQTAQCLFKAILELLMDVP